MRINTTTMKKRAQITPFIILGLVLFASFMFMFYITNSLSSKQKIKHLTFDHSTIDLYVTSCLDRVATSALVLLGKQGGYIEPPSFIQTPRYKVTYLLDNLTIRIPPVEVMESQLSSYISNNLNVACLNDFDIFRQQHWNVSYGQPDVETDINPASVVFRATFPLSVTKGDTTIKLDRFIVTKDVRLAHILSLIHI